MQATLNEKLGVEQEPYLILGACNPPLAHQALVAEPDLGTLLPCNVVVYQRDGETHISAIDAERMLSIVGNDELAPIAAEVREKLAASSSAPPPDGFRMRLPLYWAAASHPCPSRLTGLRNEKWKACRFAYYHSRG